MQYVKYLVVLLSGCIITEVLKRQFNVNVGGAPFFREFCGMWLGPALTGWGVCSIKGLGLENDPQSRRLMNLPIWVLKPKR